MRRRNRPTKPGKILLPWSTWPTIFLSPSTRLAFVGGQCCRHTLGSPPFPPGPPGDPIHSPSLAPGSIHHPPFGSKIEWAPSIRPHRFRAATPGLHPSINGSGVCRWLVGHDGCAWWQIIITFDLYIDAPRPYSRLHLRCEWIDLASSSLAPSFLLSFVHSSSQLSLLPCLDRSCLYAGNPCPA